MPKRSKGQECPAAEKQDVAKRGSPAFGGRRFATGPRFGRCGHNPRHRHRGVPKQPGRGRVSWRTLTVVQVHSLFRHRGKRFVIGRLCLAFHLVILWLLLLSGGRAEWTYRWMHDPSPAITGRLAAVRDGDPGADDRLRLARRRSRRGRRLLHMATGRGSRPRRLDLRRGCERDCASPPRSAENAARRSRCQTDPGVANGRPSARDRGWT